MEEIRKYIRDKFSTEEIIEMINSSDKRIEAIGSDSYNSHVSIYFSDNTYSDIGYSTYFEALSKSKSIVFYES
jgi:hypothetical protein